MYVEENRPSSGAVTEFWGTEFKHGSIDEMADPDILSSTRARTVQGRDEVRAFARSPRRVPRI